MKQRADLINEALTILGALPAGQEAETEDYEHVDGKVDPALDDLAGRGVYVANYNAIPEAAFMHLAAVLAYYCAGYFGVVGQELAGLLAARQQAERDLRFLNRSTTQNLPARATYF